MTVVFRNSAVGTFVQFLMTASNEVDAGGAYVGHVLGAESTVRRRGLHHCSFEDSPGDIVKGDARSLETGDPVVLEGRDKVRVG